MLTMWSASPGNTLLIWSIFHYFVSLLRISATIRSLSCRAMGPVGLRFDSGWIQESDQILVFSLLPISLTRCFRSKSLPTRMPLPCDVADPGETFVKGDLWQYLLKRILAKRLVSLVKILHTILAIRAWLKAWTSRKILQGSWGEWENPKTSSRFFSLRP